MTGFVCQSFLKERRRPPTGGLREALEESLGGGGGGGEGFSCPRPLKWGRKRPWSLCYSISTYGKTMDTAWNGMTPIGVVPVRASRLWGMERAD